MDSQEIYTQVSAHYSAASQGTSTKYGNAIAKSFGYSEGELANVAEGSNLGLSCGNPLAIASISEGETVIDLGSGAGFDVFLAANKVGASGKVIGVDMNKDMIAKAEKIKSETGTLNVEFVESGITDMSVLESGIADCIISNCVINLVPAPEKDLVFKEIFRLLKPGGRVAVSDILAKKPLPEKLRSDMAMYVGCIAGASMVSEYEEFLKDAGFKEILITDMKSDLNIYFQTDEDGVKKAECCIPAQKQKEQSENTCKPSAAACCTPNTSTGGFAMGCNISGENYVSLKESDLNEWAGSFKIYAVKK